MNRRKFLKTALLGTLGIFGGTFIENKIINFSINDYYASLSEKLYQARCKAKQTGQPQIVIQQYKKAINEIYGKYN